MISLPIHIRETRVSAMEEAIVNFMVNNEIHLSLRN